MWFGQRFFPKTIVEEDPGCTMSPCTYERHWAKPQFRWWLGEQSRPQLFGWDEGLDGTVPRTGRNGDFVGPVHDTLVTAALKEYLGRRGVPYT